MMKVCVVAGLALALTGCHSLKDYADEITQITGKPVDISALKDKDDSCVKAQLDAWASELKDMDDDTRAVIQEEIQKALANYSSIVLTPTDMTGKRTGALITIRFMNPPNGCDYGGCVNGGPINYVQSIDKTAVTGREPRNTLEKTDKLTLRTERAENQAEEWDYWTWNPNVMSFLPPLTQGSLIDDPLQGRNGDPRGWVRLYRWGSAPSDGFGCAQPLKLADLYQQ